MLPNNDTIPNWDNTGLLPARNRNFPTSSDRSPYVVSLLDIVSYFGNTESRRELLKGLLDFRAELHNAGLVRGFQWIDGSFVENVEEREDRHPEDIDLVTFFYIPDQHTQQSLLDEFAALFDHEEVKVNYTVDSYFVPLNLVSPETIVSRSIYWYSLWSHNREDYWKGYLQVDLSGLDDSEARTELERLSSAGE